MLQRRLHRAAAEHSPSPSSFVSFDAAIFGHEDLLRQSELDFDIGFFFGGKSEKILGTSNLPSLGLKTLFLRNAIFVLPLTTRELLGCRRQGWEFLLYGNDEFLDGIDFLFFEVGFATLATDPCRHFVESNMTTPAVSVEGGMASLHFALAVDALHFLILTVKSFDHSSESGIYAVITARKSPFGAQTR